MTSVSELIKMLYHERFFETERSLKDVREKLQSKGFNFSNPLISLSLKNSGFLYKKGRKGIYQFIQKLPPQTKIKEKEVSELNKIFSELMEKKLGKRFEQDVRELNIAFSYDCGNSAAFLLRKMLEKAIFFVFANNKKIDLLKDKNNHLVGLETMINFAKIEKIKGTPILLPKTADKLLGMKFLGDSAAHDYLSNVEVADINHQLPFWTMAIKELSERI